MQDEPATPAPDMVDASLLRQLSAIEESMCAKIAERGLKCSDESGQRILRSNWHLARNRADIFMELAMDIEAGLTIHAKAQSND